MIVIEPSQYMSSQMNI